MCIIGIDLDTLDFAGAWVHDPLAAVVFCRPPNVDWSVVNGRVVVEDGRVITLDLPHFLRRHNEIARRMVERAGV